MRLLTLFLLACAGLLAQTEPQAYVPMLFPIAQVEPVYDPARLPARLVNVQLLLTIDPSGQVAAVEVLTGSPAYRDAAVAAVRQWRYRPVLRNGQPVFAYTQAAVTFNGPRDKTPLSEPFDATSTMAASMRTMEMQKRFPRTPAQEFADLEQDRGSASGSTRAFVLPDLAKAAFKAGFYDKALVFVNEMLGLDASSPNWGSAVHDGHMVRGLLALRQGNVEQAKQDLLAAGANTGSPVLMSFGPNMNLAKALVEKGERDTVLQYFARCKQFWQMGQEKLDQWSATVRGGGTPDFGANLFY